MKFSRAQRKQAKLRLALSGPAGSGKTWGALQIAKGIGGKIAVIDTERGSASLYSDLVEFDTLELQPPYSPERYIEAIETAEKAGYDIVIVDSATHEWSGSGGCLEINETAASTKFRGNSWAAWNETTPRHRAFIDAMLQAGMHVIATSRSKTETVQTEDKKVKKVGMKAEQREGFEYEFALVFEIDHEKHMAVATKDRTRLFPEPHKITEATGAKLAAWLNSGAELAPEAPKPVRSFVTDPAGDGVPDVEIAESTVSRFCEYAKTTDDAAIRELWASAKGEQTTAAYAWRLLKEKHPLEFKYVSNVLRPKQENAA